ncbi:MAG: VacB/RNase II family 3'-5' exoribonuclease [Kiritimatiellae bacterium]|nr:VacB/RNase II family 3'-5' exoribonuclease [Kiritimatiellia bacterium]
MTRGASLETRLYALFSRPDYRPLKHHEIANVLHLKGGERSALRALLRKGKEEGRLSILRKNRWALSQNDRLISARISMLPNGGAIATSTADPPLEYFIGRSALAGAIHGDMVTLELFSRRRRTDDSQRQEAKVVRVTARRQRAIAGRLMRNRYFWYVIPEHSRIRDNIRVRSTEAEIELIEHHYVVVELEAWSGAGELLRGKVVEDLGDEDLPHLREIILLRNRDLVKTFDDDVTAAARARSPELSSDDLRDREDCRELLSLTIDPATAHDFDDAVSLIEAPGGWELGVHIADVSHFVAVGSPIDREAEKRGNSVYLTGDFIPMLPPHLTADVCSLRPNVDRLAFSVWLSLNHEGKVIRHRVAQTVINSKARLNYDEVQEHFDNPSASNIPKGLHDTLRAMRELAHRVRARRIKAGALNLSMPEVSCDLDADGNVTAIRKRGAPEAYNLIEEFMLLANVAVAERLAAGKAPALYRIHDAPDEEQWEEMRSALQLLGINHPVNSKEYLNEICEQIEEKPVAYSANLAILRNLKRALYSDRPSEHFGLGFPRYTHFTSPIRRYPDLLVHRLLKAEEAHRRSPYDRDAIRRLALHCSETERNADEAEEESLRRKCMDYYAALLKKGEIGPYPALVTGVLSRGLLVELTDSLQRGLIPMRALGEDFFEANPERGLVVGRRSRRTIRVGQTVEVEILRVDIERGQMDFNLASPPKTERRIVSESDKSASARRRRVRHRGRAR